jgi:pseudaminic acid synthase
MIKQFEIQGRKIGAGHPCYIIAEISCNHNGDFDEAVKIIKAAKDAGADAVKIQTYTADTMTRDFAKMPKGTMWEGLDLHSLYKKAETPWGWHEKLKAVADAEGLHIFSSPFDETAVDYLVAQNVPVLKLASFEVVDIKLIEKMASTGLPIIMSNGMTDFLEMDEAIRTLRKFGAKDIALLHCNSGYPARFEEANLKTIPVLGEMFDCVTGLSDHTLYRDAANHADPMAHIAPLEAVKLGASIIELHLQLDRAEAKTLFDKDEGGYDWSFSREPQELKKTIDMIRMYEKTGQAEYETTAEQETAKISLGEVSFDPTEKEMNSRKLRPTLWVTKDIKKGEVLSFETEINGDGNFTSIRPGGGLHIRHTDFIEGKVAAVDIAKGEPLQWHMVDVEAGSSVTRKVA